MVDVRANFSGSIPEYYDRCLGPAWFDAFAAELARRMPAKPPGAVLEVACGTGLMARHLRGRLDPSVRLVATDLSKAMVDYARNKHRALTGIEWREADALKLPFADSEFGALACAFGVMFVPDKPAAFREARRVLKSGGLFLFDTWDRVEEVSQATANARVVERLFPGDPEMQFNTPYEMHDPKQLEALLAGAGFRDWRIEKVRIAYDRVSARTIAEGVVRGTPRSAVFEKRGVPLEKVIAAMEEELSRTGGSDPYRGSAQALMVEARAG